MIAKETSRRATKKIIEVIYEPQWSLKEPNFAVA
jgi:hypothetical protein